VGLVLAHGLLRITESNGRNIPGSSGFKGGIAGKVTEKGARIQSLGN